MKRQEMGTIRVANDVVYTLVAEAVAKTEGVYQLLGYEKQQVDKKNKNGPVVDFTDDRNFVQVTIVADEGYSILATAENVQKNIQEQLMSMLRIDAKDIHVIVHSVHYENPKKAK